MIDSTWACRGKAFCKIQDNDNNKKINHLQENFRND